MAPKPTQVSSKPANSKKRKASVLEDDPRPLLVAQEALVIYTGQDVEFERVFIRTYRFRPLGEHAGCLTRFPSFLPAFSAGTSLNDVKSSIRKKLRLADGQDISLTYRKSDPTERAIEILDGQSAALPSRPFASKLTTRPFRRRGL